MMKTKRKWEWKGRKSTNLQRRSIRKLDDNQLTNEEGNDEKEEKKKEDERHIRRSPSRSCKAIRNLLKLLFEEFGVGEVCHSQVSHRNLPHLTLSGEGEGGGRGREEKASRRERIR